MITKNGGFKANFQERTKEDEKLKDDWRTWIREYVGVDCGSCMYVWTLWRDPHNKKNDVYYRVWMEREHDNSVMCLDGIDGGASDRESCRYVSSCDGLLSIVLDRLKSSTI